MLQKFNRVVNETPRVLGIHGLYELPGCVALHPTSESIVITSVIIVGVVITFSFMS